jgi:hypothetical protein
MSTQPFDYAAILTDLEAKKAAIEAAIASMRQAMGLGALGQTGDGTGVSGMSSPSLSIHNGDIPNGAFLGKSIPEAAKLYLEILKKKQTSREIADALLKGGMESTSKNFYGIVHAVLDRARKSPNSALVKLGTHWGLALWYPKGIISGASASIPKKGKKKGRKAKQSGNATTAETTTIETTKESMSQPGSVTDRAIGLLKTKPEREYSLKEIAEHLGMGESGARLNLGRLVKAGRLRVTAPGMYAIGRPQLAAAGD